MEASGGLSTTSVLTPVPVATLLSSLTSTALNASSAYLRAPSPKDLILVPLRGIAKLDDLLVRRIPNYILEHARFGTWTNQAGAVLNSLLHPGANGGAGVMADAAAQTAAGQVAAQTATGWKTLFAEAFQASTFKSYFGMLHYLTSRWAFTCFTMVRLKSYY
jgi:hypothetical protein